jgi:hypothetical protein
MNEYQYSFLTNLFDKIADLGPALHSIITCVVCMGVVVIAFFIKDLIVKSLCYPKFVSWI